MQPEYTSFFAMVGMRFLRGFIAGFIGSMALFVQSNPNYLTDYKAWIASAISAGITGAALSVDKALRADGTDYQS